MTKYFISVLTEKAVLLETTATPTVKYWVPLSIIEKANPGIILVLNTPMELTIPAWFKLTPAEEGKGNFKPFAKKTDKTDSTTKKTQSEETVMLVTILNYVQGLVTEIHDLRQSIEKLQKIAIIPTTAPLTAQPPTTPATTGQNKDMSTKP